MPFCGSNTLFYYLLLLNLRSGVFFFFFFFFCLFIIGREHDLRLAIAMLFLQLSVVIKSLVLYCCAESTADPNATLYSPSDLVSLA